MHNGRTALIVEEEFLIALDIQRMLENQGIGHTLFARTPAEAAQLQPRLDDLAIAIVEMHAHDAAVFRLIEDLRTAGVPIVLITSDVAFRSRSGSGLSDLAVVIKPIPEDGMANAIRHAVAARS